LADQQWQLTPKLDAPAPVVVENSVENMHQYIDGPVEWPVVTSDTTSAGGPMVYSM